MRRTLEKYFKKRHSLVDGLLKKKTKLSFEDFHKLRVEIKKIKALTTMLGHLSNKFKRKKCTEGYVKLFKKAGKIRELQLEKKVLFENDAKQRFVKFYDDLNLKIVQETKGFYTMWPGAKDKIKKNSEAIVHAINNADRNDAHTYIKEKRKKIIFLLKQKKLKILQVHELRKRLKEFFYNLKSLHLSGDVKVFENGDALQELMGKWHDYRLMSRHFIVTASKKIIRQAEKKRIIQLASKLDSKSEKLYGRINVLKQKVYLLIQ